MSDLLGGIEALAEEYRRGYRLRPAEVCVPPHELERWGAEALQASANRLRVKIVVVANWNEEPIRTFEPRGIA